MQTSKSFVLTFKYEILLFLLAFTILFLNLGDRTFGDDEQFGVEIALNIARTGVPMINDGTDIDNTPTLTVNSPLSHDFMNANIVTSSEP